MLKLDLLSVDEARGRATLKALAILCDTISSRNDSIHIDEPEKVWDG